MAGHRSEIGPPRLRGVLSVLAVDAGRPVMLESLVDRVWGDSPPSRARHAVQVYVSRLRTVLATAGDGQKVRLPRRSGGYLLDIDPGLVDVHRFHQLVARPHAGRQPDQVRAARLREALALWRGVPLSQMPGEWAATVRHTWQQQWIDATVEWAALQERLGDPATAIGPLADLLVEHPLHERATATLMRALHALGRTAEALAPYDRLRRSLAEQLGVDPSAELRDLYVGVLRGDPPASGTARTALRVDPSAAWPGLPGADAEDPDGELIGREGQLAALRRLAAAAGTGRGAAVVVRGASGMGKTALLAKWVAGETAGGARVLRASGGELEQGFAFAVVRQLLEPVVGRAAADARSRLLAGPARQAIPVLLTEAGAEAHPPDTREGLLYGLFWLVVNLCDDGPVILLVDDAHWSDAPSLRWLDYLTRRIADLPLLVVLAAHADGGSPATALLDRIEAQPAGHPLTLPALTHEAVTRRVRLEWPHAAAEFCTACADASEGNPFLLDKLLLALRRHDVEPTARHAHRVAELTAPLRAADVVRRLAGQEEDTRRLARALAVLGDGAGWPAVAALSALSDAECRDHADRLRRIGVLGPPDGVARFSHPSIRPTITETGTTPVELAAEHARAAEVLHADGTAAEQVAAHLLLAEPGDGDWRIGVLREAAGVARRRGAPETSATYLRRALRERTTEQQYGDLVLELSGDEVVTDPDTAVRRLSLALPRLTDPLVRGGAAGLLAGALFARQQHEPAMDTLERAVADLQSLDGAGRELWWHLQAQLVIIGYGRPSTISTARTWARRLREFRLPGDTPGQRAVLLALAVPAMMGEADAATVNDLLDRALRSEMAVDARSETTLAFAGLGYALTDRLDDADLRYEQLSELAGRCGSARMSAQALSGLLGVRLRRGEQVPLSARLGHTGPDSPELADLPARLSFVTTAVSSLLERGEPDAAADVLARHTGGAVDDSVLWGAALLSSCRIRAELGDLTGALAMLLAYGSHERDAGLGSPAISPWRTQAALIHAALGQQEEARQLATEELEAAYRWGTPRVIGVALHCQGVVGGGAESRTLLAEAVTVLRQSPARLELARAQYAWGRALRQAGEPGNALRILGEALTLAQECGATVLAGQIRAELVAGGGRPGPVPPVPPSQSIIELRVAGLRSAGRTDRQIAQSLLLTPDAVAAIGR